MKPPQKLTLEPPADVARRRAWRAYSALCDRIRHQPRAITQVCVRVGGFPIVVDMDEPPRLPPFPDELRGLACGATTRRGNPCKRTDLMASGRCKFHGGCSTGPKTSEGKRKAQANLKLRWKRNGD